MSYISYMYPVICHYLCHQNFSHCVDASTIIIANISGKVMKRCEIKPENGDMTFTYSATRFLETRRRDLMNISH